MKRLFIYLGLIFWLITSANAQNINKAEYYFDSDPGYGNGIDVPLSQSTDIDFNFTANTSSLSDGVHRLYFRVRAGNVWSNTYSRTVAKSGTGVISQAEYYYDTDPGFGNATAISITAGSLVDINFTANTSNMSAGIHRIYIRVFGSTGWSTTYSRLVAKAGTGIITQAEYYFDNDPGFGSGTAISFAQGSLVDLNFSANTSGISEGIHQLYVRTLGANGWSQTYHRTVAKSGTGLISKAEYYFDSDPGFGNGTDISITPGSDVDISFTANTSGISDGIHRIYIRTLDAGGWSPTYSRLVAKSGSGTITAAEYYFDNDPGFGSGTAISFTQGSDVDLNFTANTSGISDGIHQIYVRTLGPTGWSQTYHRTVAKSGTGVISKAEYYFDNDPGFGSGTPISITPGSNVDINFIANTSGISDGIHRLFIRVLDAGGWSPTYSKLIAKAGTELITKAEYYFDNDPGFGNGTSISISQGKLVDINFTANTSSLSSGSHQLYMRVYGGMGWSQTYSKEICKTSISAFATDTVCLGNITHFTDQTTETNSNTTYQWDINDDGTIDYTTSGNITHTYSTAGTFTAVLITGETGACHDTLRQTVIVNALPNASFSGLNSTYCDNSASSDLAGTPANGTFSGSGMTASNFNPANASVGTHWIYYLYSDNNGCIDIDSQSVIVNAAPTIAFSALSNICANVADFPLSGGSPTNGIYSGTGVSSGDFSPNTTGAGSFAITYTYTDGNGCTDSASQNQVVNSAPTVTLSSLADVCADAASFSLSGGSPINGTYSGTGVANNIFNAATAGIGTHSIKYLFTNSNGCSDSTTQNQIVNSLPNVSFTSLADVCVSAADFNLSGGSPSNGTYSGTAVNNGSFSPSTATAGSFALTYSYTDANGCSDTAIQNQQVNTLPTVTFSSLSDICADAINFSLSGGSPANGTYSGTGVSNGNFSANTAGVGTHIITYVFTDGKGCTDSTTQNQIVNSLPTITFSSLSDICADASSFSLSGGSPANGTYSGIGVANGDFNAATAGVGTHSIQYLFTNTNGCSDSTTQNQIVNSLPNVSFTSLGDVCVSAADFTLSGGSPSNGTYSGTAVSNGIFSPSTATVGSFALTYTYSDANGCSDTAIQNQQVNTLPTVTFSSLSDICADAINFSLSGGSPANGTYSGTGVSNGNFSVNTAGVGTHTITYVFTDGNSCTDSTTQTQKINPNPTASITATTNPVNYGFSTALSGGANGGIGIYKYLWTPASSVNGATNIQNISTSGLISNTLFTLTLKDSTATTVCEDTAMILVNVSGGPLTVAPYASNDTVCQLSTLDLFASSSGGGTAHTFIWSSNPIGFSSALENPNTNPIVSAWYIIVVSDGVNTSTDSVFVLVNSLPNVIFSINDTICFGENSQLNTSFTGASPWNFSYTENGGTAISVIGTNSPWNNTFSPNSTTEYIITSLTDANGCGLNTNYDTVNIVVNTLPNVILSSLNDVCADAAIFSLIGGSPINGTYSGTGVQSGSFNANNAGTGTHGITYTYTDANGCSDSAQQNQIVNALPTVGFSTLADVCASAANFTLSGGSPNNGAYSGTAVNNGSFSPSTATAGSFALTYSYTDANGCSDTAIQNQIVNALPLVIFSTLNDICADVSDFTLSGGSPNNGLYSGTGVSNGNFSANTAGVGTHTITYVFTDGNSCTDSTTQTQKINPNPTASITATTNPVNYGFSTALNGGASGGIGTYKYSWSPTISINGAANLQSVNTIGLASNTLFTLTLKDSTATTVCEDTAMILVNVNGGPLTAAPYVSNDTICQLSTLNLFASSSGGGITHTFIWSSNPVGFSSVLENPNTNPIVSAWYIVDVSDGVNTISDSVYVLVNSLPTVLYSSSDTVCNGDSTQLSASFTGASPWNFSYTENGGTAIPIIGSNSPWNNTISPASSTEYIITSLTDANGCGLNANYDTVNIVVNALPSVSLSALLDVCANTVSFSLSGGSPTNGIYSGIGVTNATFNSAIAGVGTHGISYLYTDANGCSDSTQQNQVVNPLPTASISAITNPVAYGLATALSASASGGIGTYLYSWAPSSSINGATNMQSAVSTNLIANTLFTITVIDSTATTLCQDTAQLWVNISGGPLSISPIVDNDTICKYDTINLQANSVGGTSSLNYSWTSNPMGFSSTMENPISIPLQSAWYIAEVSDGNYTTKDSVFITVNQLPIVSFSGLASSYCTNSIADTLLGNPLGGSFVGNGINTNIFSPQNAGTGSHDIIYSYIDINGCTNSDTNSATINQIPTISIGADTTICAYDSLLLNVGNFSSYLWNTGDTTQSIYVDSLGLGIGTFVYDIMAIDTNNCSVSDSISITYEASPISQLSDSASICGLGQSLVLDAGFNSNYSYLWSNASTNSTLSVDTILLGGLTNYISINISSPAGCSISDSSYVWFKALPSINLGNDTTICWNQHITLDAGSGFNSYLWSNNSNTQYLSLDSFSFVMGANTYWVEVSNSENCYNSDSLILMVDACTGFNNNDLSTVDVRIIPNPSKGQFQINIEGLENQYYELKLYNSEGQQIYFEEIKSFGQSIQTVKFDLSTKAKGIYFIQLITLDKIVFTGKVLVN